MLSTVVISILLLLTQQIHPTDQLETIQTALSSTVELPCSILSQNIESMNLAKIIWIRDDQADIVSLDSLITVRDPRLSILTTDNIDRQERTLRITNIEEQDHGLYRCIQGDMILNEVLLDVLIPPRIVYYSPEHMHVTVREGDDVQFACVATGHPLPDILWHVNGLSRPGIVITVEGKNESILTLHNVTRFDSGRVDCSASNTLSTVNRQFLLYVKYKPMVTVPSHALSFRLYESAKLTCQVCAVPSPTVFDFFRPKQAIPMIKGVKTKFDDSINQTCRRLTITLELTDASLFGSYVCRARNSMGVNHAEFIIRESMKSTKRMKYVAEHRPLSAIITSPSPPKNPTNLFQSNPVTARKNQSYQLSTSIFLVIISLITMI